MKPTILIVEDVSSDIDVLNHILNKHYTILIAKTGEAAIKAASENHPELILLDIILPDMTGFSVLSILKESNVTKGIPIIIITAINNSQYEEKGISLGAVDYITKPFHNAVVRARISTHMQVARYIRTIEQLGLVDTLTELPNRRSFENLIKTEWARCARDRHPLGALIVDVDHFKRYNDIHGSPRGDELLKNLALIVQAPLKRPADVAARWGDDEFIVLLPNTDSAGTRRIAEAIRGGVESLKEPLGEKDWMSDSVTVGIGVASIVPNLERPCDELIDATVESLGAAKRAGGNQVGP